VASKAAPKIRTRKPKGLPLDEPVHQERPDPLLETVRPDLRLADGDPHPPPPVDAVGEDGHGDRGEEKEDGLKILGIPEDLPAFVSDGKCDVLHNPSREKRVTAPYCCNRTLSLFIC
jgi:hypothetical protein